MSLVPKDGKYFTEVDALTEETHDTLIPDGETWQLISFVGTAAFLDDTAACLIWDPDGVNTLLECTHGEKTSAIDEQLVGDGVKVIRISLQNDTNTARVLGCKWEGRRL
jgi:hypothetical protein